MWYYWFIGGYLAGLIVALLSGAFKKKDGTLEIDRSNPEKDIYRLDIDDLDNLHKKSKIVLKVDKDAQLNIEHTQI